MTRHRRDAATQLSRRAARTSTSLAIDGLVVIAIVSITISLLLPAGWASTTKARLTDIFSSLPTRRLAISEDIALRGDAGDGELYQRKAERKRMSADLVADLQGYGDNRDKVDRSDDLQRGASSGQAGLGMKLSAEQRDAMARIQFAEDGATLVARGRIGKSDSDAFALPFVPSTIAEGPIGNILWLCGQRQPPSGWRRMTASTPTDMPDGLSFSVCREAKP